MGRKLTPIPKLRNIGNARARQLQDMKCANGHEFGLNRDLFTKAYKVLPSTILCPHPRCNDRVPIKKETNER